MHLELKALEITVVDCRVCVITLLNKNNCYVIFVDVHSVSVLSTPYTLVGGELCPATSMNCFHLGKSLSAHHIIAHTHVWEIIL